MSYSQVGKDQRPFSLWKVKFYLRLIFNLISKNLISRKWKNLRGGSLSVFQQECLSTKLSSAQNMRSHEKSFTVELVFTKNLYIRRDIGRGVLYNFHRLEYWTRCPAQLPQARILDGVSCKSWAVDFATGTLD